MGGLPVIYSFLMIGQSNMAGRGFPKDVEPISFENLWVLRSGLWRPCAVPVNPDRPFSGVSLAESFARRCADLHGVEVGLIPCADGGTCLEQWMPGQPLYDHAVMQAGLAMCSSRLAGVLWHQGESDCQNPAGYGEALLSMLNSLRRELGDPELPVVLGGLGAYLAENPGYERFGEINGALEKTARRGGNMAYVSAEGLTSNPDRLHFNGPSLRILGLRYEEAYEGLNHPAFRDIPGGV